MPDSAEPGVGRQRPTAMRPATVLLATAFLAAACSQAGPGEGANGPHQAEPAPSSSAPPTTPPPSSPPPTAPLESVMVQRTGGIAGMNDKYTVTPQGALTATTRTGTVNRQLGPADLSKLRTLAADPAFPAEAKAARTSSNPRCRDGFNYSVTIGSSTVSGTDCGGNLAQAAPTMWKIVQLVEGAAQA